MNSQTVSVLSFALVLVGVRDAAAAAHTLVSEEVCTRAHASEESPGNT